MAVIVLELWMTFLSLLPRFVRRFIYETSYIISRFYFFFITSAFWLYHSLFTKKVTVPPPSDDLLQISATQAARMIRDKEISSLELIDAYIRRIEEVNGILNAVVQENFEKARKQAADVDDEVENATAQQIAEMEEKRPLLGVPFTIKDCIEIEGMKCTYGVFHRKNSRAEKTATAVERMFSAGAILLCITNVPEVCMWWETVNKIYGRTSNPYDNRRICGGSSGGEGSLLAAAASLISVGSDIGGSVRMPAFFNGVFGLKPSPGTIPLTGHLPPVSGYRKQMLTIGPLCRYASDLEVMFKVLGGENVVPLRLSEPVQMHKLRVFYMEGLRSPLLEGTDNEMKYALRRAVRYMEMKYDLAAVRIDLPLAHLVVQMFMSSMENDEDPKFSELLSSEKGGRVSCATEMVKCVAGRSNHTFPALLVGLLDDFESFGDEHKKRFLYKRDRLIRELKDLLGDNGVLLFPSAPSAAPFHNQPVFTPLNFTYTGLFNALGLPVAQCPMGISPSKGVPLGVQVVGSPLTERNLIGIAKDLEEGFGGWTVPGK